MSSGTYLVGLRVPCITGNTFGERAAVRVGSSGLDRLRYGTIALAVQITVRIVDQARDDHVDRPVVDDADPERNVATRLRQSGRVRHLLHGYRRRLNPDVDREPRLTIAFRRRARERVGGGSARLIRPRLPPARAVGQPQQAGGRVADARGADGEAKELRVVC